MWRVLLLMLDLDEDGWFIFRKKLNNSLAASIGPDWWPKSMPGSGCLSSDKRFKSTNLQAGSSLLITVGDSPAESAFNLSWLIYSLAHPGHISNASSHSWLSRLKEPRKDCKGLPLRPGPAMSGQHSLALIRTKSREMSLWGDHRERRES